MHSLSTNKPHKQNTMHLPKVTVVMAAYNSAAFIHHGIDSFLEQTYKNAELLICDDGSKDATRQIALTYALQHPTIKVIYNEPNKGYVATMNRMFDEADGDYICILDSDDRMTKDRIERQLEIIETYKADAVISEYIYHDGKDDYNYARQKYDEPTPISSNSADVISASGSLMMSKEVQKAIIGYDPYFSDAFCADNYFITKISERFKLYYDPKHLYYYTQTPGSMTQVFSLYKLSKQSLVLELIKQRQLTGTDLLESNQLGELETRRTAIMKDRKWRSHYYQLYGARYIDQQMARQGIMMALKSAYYNPSNTNAFRTLIYGLKRMVSKK